MDKHLICELRQALQARLEEIESLRADAADTRKTVTLDQTSVGRVSRIDALQAQQMALAQDRNRAAERVRIEAALQRIEDGSYGICLVCEEDIAEKRLRLSPAVATCISCAK